jgi:hypothetical protein
MAVWSLLRETASRYSGHKASLLGAALAYYSVFSLGPLMVIAIAIAGLVFGDDAARGEVGTQLKDLPGNTGAQAVEAMLAGAGRRHNGVVAGRRTAPAMRRTGATCSSSCRSNAPPPRRRSEPPLRFSPPSAPATPAARSPSSTPACRPARNLFEQRSCEEVVYAVGPLAR